MDASCKRAEGKMARKSPAKSGDVGNSEPVGETAKKRDYPFSGKGTASGSEILLSDGKINDCVGFKLS